MQYIPDPPTFTLKQVINAIPPKCMMPNLYRSVFWYLFDMVVIGGLFLWGLSIQLWYLWPVYWFCLGSALWSLFMIGHECGHGSFSQSKKVNNLFGHLSHTLLLVPFHGWRISHRKHHQNTGHFKNDESHVPVVEKTYIKVRKNFDFQLLMVIYYLGLFFPLYLLINRRRDLKMNHFLPSSLLFKPAERADVLTSSFLFLMMVITLGLACMMWGLGTVFRLYFVPWMIFLMWLDTVTYLQHTDKRLLWFRDGQWNFLRGSLSTMDRDYGRIFNFFHHNIGSHHVVHHLCASIPHYHLKEATAAVRPILGELYNQCPRGIVASYLDSIKNCKFIPDEGEVVMFLPDEKAVPLVQPVLEQ